MLSLGTCQQTLFAFLLLVLAQRHQSSPEIELRRFTKLLDRVHVTIDHYILEGGGEGMQFAKKKSCKAFKEGKQKSCTLKQTKLYCEVVTKRCI